jgi:hypothetical protein
MSYNGKTNYEDRDRLFEKSFQERGTNKTQVKKDLEDLFKAKPKEPIPEPGVTVTAAPVSACQAGHAWIRDWDGVYKCVRCKTPKPIAPKASHPSV